MIAEHLEGCFLVDAVPLHQDPLRALDVFEQFTEDRTARAGPAGVAGGHVDD
jgi:hypothetical protein